jgi:hypothetical protein
VKTCWQPAFTQRTCLPTKMSGIRSLVLQCGQVVSTIAPFQQGRSAGHRGRDSVLARGGGQETASPVGDTRNPTHVCAGQGKNCPRVVEFGLAVGLCGACAHGKRLSTRHLALSSAGTGFCHAAGGVRFGGGWLGQSAAVPKPGRALSKGTVPFSSDENRDSPQRGKGGQAPWRPRLSHCQDNLRHGASPLFSSDRPQ